jgi:hypothetical protein
MNASLRPDTTSDAIREAFQTFSPDKETLTATAVLSIFRQHPDWRELSPAQLGYRPNGIAGSGEEFRDLSPPDIIKVCRQEIGRWDRMKDVAPSGHVFFILYLQRRVIDEDPTLTGEELLLGSLSYRATIWLSKVIEDVQPTIGAQVRGFHVSRKVVERYREYRSELYRNAFSGRRRQKVEEPTSPNGAPIEIVKTWSDFYDQMLKENPQQPGESNGDYDKRNSALWMEWCQTLTDDEQRALDRETKLAKKRNRYQATHGAPGEDVSLSSLYAGVWSAPTVTEIEMTKDAMRREKDRIKKSNQYYAPKKEEDRPTPTRRRKLAPKAHRERLERIRAALTGRDEIDLEAVEDFIESGC